MLPTVSIDEFISDRQTLGRWFSGDSWNNWKLVLKAAFGEHLTPREHYQFYEIADRSPPRKKVSELWCLVGRRGGKDSIASAIAAYVAALTDFRPYLRPGEKATILCLACDRSQAKIQQSYIAAYFSECPLLKPLVKYISDSDGYLELKNGVEIIVQTNSYRSVRGRAVALAILSEASFYRSDDSASPDTELYAAIRPSLVSLRPNSMIIGISSVYKRSGLMFDKWKSHHGVAGENGDVLVIRAPSRTFNPTIPQDEIDADLEADPQKAAAEWMSDFRDDVSSWISSECIELATIPDVTEIPYTGRYAGSYVGFADSAGGSGGDSFCIAVAHLEGDRAILDLVEEVRPPFSPEAATERLCDTLKRYRITKVVGDKYAGDWPSEAFLRNGILYEASERTKSDIYKELAPLLNSRRVDLIDNKRLLSQFRQLEARSIRGGRVTVDHPQGAHDDLANAAAGALTLLVSDDRSAIVKRYLLRGSGRI